MGIRLHAQVGGVHHVDGAQVDHPFRLAVVGGQQGKGQVLVLVRRPRAGVGAGKHHAHLIRLRRDPAQRVGIPAAQLRQVQRRGVVVAQHHQRVFAPGLQHDRAPFRPGGRAVRLDGGGQQAGFGEGTRRWETVLCLAHLHQRARGALGGKPQVHPRVVRRCVQHEGLRQRIHGLHAEVDDLRHLAVGALALAGEQRRSRAAARAPEVHRLGACGHVGRNGEGSRQHALRIGHQRSTWQRRGHHRHAVERDGLQGFAGAEIQVKAHIDLAQVFQRRCGLAAHLGFVHAHRGCKPVDRHRCGKAPGVVHIRPAVHRRRERDGAGQRVERAVRVHQHGPSARQLRQGSAVGVGRALPRLDGRADLVHREVDRQAQGAGRDQRGLRLACVAHGIGQHRVCEQPFLDARVPARDIHGQAQLCLVQQDARDHGAVVRNLRHGHHAHAVQRDAALRVPGLVDRCDGEHVARHLRGDGNPGGRHAAYPCNIPIGRQREAVDAAQREVIGQQHCGASDCARHGQAARIHFGGRNHGDVKVRDLVGAARCGLCTACGPVHLPGRQLVVGGVGECGAALLDQLDLLHAVVGQRVGRAHKATVHHVHRAALDDAHLWHAHHGPAVEVDALRAVRGGQVGFTVDPLQVRLRVEHHAPPAGQLQRGAADSGRPFAQVVDLFARGQVGRHAQLHAPHDVRAARARYVIGFDGRGNCVDVGRRFLRPHPSILNCPHREELTGLAAALHAPSQLHALAGGAGFFVAVSAHGWIQQLGVFKLGDGVAGQVHAHEHHAHGGDHQGSGRHAAHGARHVDGAALAGGGACVVVHDDARAADDGTFLHQNARDTCNPCVHGALHFVQLGTLQHLVRAEQVAVVVLGRVEPVINGKWVCAHGQKGRTYSKVWRTAPLRVKAGTRSRV